MEILIIAISGFILGGVTGASLYRWHRRELDGLNARHERELQHLDEGLKGLCRFGTQYNPSYRVDSKDLGRMSFNAGYTHTPDGQRDVWERSLILDPRPSYVIQHEREGDWGSYYADKDAQSDATAERQQRAAEVMPDGEGIRL